MKGDIVALLEDRMDNNQLVGISIFTSTETCALYVADVPMMIHVDSSNVVVEFKGGMNFMLNLNLETTYDEYEQEYTLLDGNTHITVA